jgi:hypothetical protein
VLVAVHQAAEFGGLRYVPENTTREFGRIP